MTTERAVSWQECLVCGGVVAVWRDPEQPTPAGMARFNAGLYAHRDGMCLVDGTLLRCADCGDWWCAADALVPEQRRWGAALPPERGEGHGDCHGG